MKCNKLYLYVVIILYYRDLLLQKLSSLFPQNTVRIWKFDSTGRVSRRKLLTETYIKFYYLFFANLLIFFLCYHRDIFKKYKYVHKL